MRVTPLSTNKANVSAFATIILPMARSTSSLNGKSWIRKKPQLANQLQINMNVGAVVTSELQTPKQVISVQDGRPIMPFYTHRYCFSNFFQTKFKFDGHEFYTSEQAFMYSKAKQFKDDQSKEAILRETDPKRCKMLGRKVSGFDKTLWDQISLNIMVEVLREKFGQNQTLREFLIGTGNALLAEAAPRDRIWGIGMGENNPKVANPKLWRGRNLLGVALMQVREELKTSNT
ncbi:NADAR family protein [Aphelenchoides besseyi]|nr:NADAR family protein [Aphelenchoides besseyi]KAI6211208.1 NADAR family protein [Aphelenchoides besseyi]